MDEYILNDNMLFDDPMWHVENWVKHHTEIKPGNKEDYFSIGPIGSRQDWVVFYKKDGTIAVKCGCWDGDIHTFRKRVADVHGESRHGKLYQIAADMAELKFAVSKMG